MRENPSRSAEIFTLIRNMVGNVLHLQSGLLIRDLPQLDRSICIM